MQFLILKIINYIHHRHIKIMTLSQFQLEVEFLKSDIDRINNESYFEKSFQCADLIKLFVQCETIKQIAQKKSQINLIYDNFLALEEKNRSVYTVLKWIHIFHQIIQKLKENTPLFSYTLKSFQVCLELLVSFEKNQMPYEKYILKHLVRPYIQYLSKLCLLNMPQQTSKYDESSSKTIQTNIEDDDKGEQKMNQQNAEQENLNMKLIDWYRRYNFLTQTLQTFDYVICDSFRFFNSSFPFLTNIGKLLLQDMNSMIFKLKYVYRYLKKSNVTVIELDQLQNRLKLFSSKLNECYQYNIFQLGAKLDEFSKKDLQQFLESPLKPCQLKLYSVKSEVSPININNQF